MPARHDSSPTPSEHPDTVFRVLVVIIGLVMMWLIAMPFVPAIASSTMHRFHLRSESFAWWAIQQAIPPMYSFRNTTEIRSSPPPTSVARSPSRESIMELVDPILQDLDVLTPMDPTAIDDGLIAARTINHFPTREFTFGNGRYRYLRDATNRYFVLQSDYRGQTLRSVYHLARDAGGTWDVSWRDATEAAP